MPQTKKTTQAQTFSRLLQELQTRASDACFPEDHQRALLLMIANVLRTWAKTEERSVSVVDMHEIRGHAHVKRALEVAAAGGHNILLIGPPGAGKAALARSLPSLLPTSASSYPFRMPPTTSTSVTFIGTPQLPGELTLAHGGVLFLENIAAFDAPLLHAVRQAVETHVLALQQGEATTLYPAHFQLVATIQPCPCGFYGDRIRECLCSAQAIQEYVHRVEEWTEALFDIHVEVERVQEEILSTRQEESSLRIRQRVEAARARQRQRYAEESGGQKRQVNADLVFINETQTYCELEPSAQKLLKAVLQQLHPSAHGMLRIQRVARTIADLGGMPHIAANHIAEATQYRSRF